MLGFIFFDPVYLILVLGPSLLIGGLATMLTRATFNKYSRVGSRRGLTGADAAREMLRRAGISGVEVDQVGGFLSDHYDPRQRVLRLSPDVYGGRSLAAIGVACHEAGHAIQHARNFLPLHVRSLLVPVTNLCSTLYVWVIIIGAFMHVRELQLLGLAMCAMALVFAVVTLPVEWDASRRAKQAIAQHQLLAPDELGGAARVLNAAFLTYVASVFAALLTLLYWLWRLGLLGGRR